MTTFTIIHLTPASCTDWFGGEDQNYITREAQTKINITRNIVEAATFWMDGIKLASGNGGSTHLLINGREPLDCPWAENVDINDHIDDESFTAQETADYAEFKRLTDERVAKWQADQAAAAAAERDRLANLAVEKARQLQRAQREADEVAFEQLKRKLGK